MRTSWVAGLALLGVGAAAGGYVLLAEDPKGAVRAAPSPSASPDPSRTPLLMSNRAGAAPTAAGVRRALAGALKDPGLGTRLAASVVDTATGAPLLQLGATGPVTPASTAKIATAVAVLSVLAPDQRITTQVVQGAPGDVVLVGAGDPTLSGAHADHGFPTPARLSDLAAQLRTTAVRRVVVDDGLFTGPRLGPGWKPGYVTSGDVAPVSALAVDGGRQSLTKNQPRVADPALEAGRQLAALLRVKPVVRGVAPAGAVVLAHVDSPTVSELVESMLTRSDNDLAEALGRQLALASKQPASFVGAAAATRTVLTPLLGGLTVDLRDASGLSPLNRVVPAALTRLLAAVGRDPRFAPVLSGLPVAGFDGTLAKRFRTAPTSSAAGEVRAKTGTLDGVSALAGLVRTRSGHLLAFDLTADGVPVTGTATAQAALDRLAAALAACGCA